MTIKEWLQGATNQLADSDIKSARLDAELLLCYALNKDKTYLHGHGDENIDDKDIAKLDILLNRRLQHTPMAYILGYKEFYGRKFIVNENVLIPRPETEDLIDEVKRIAGFEKSLDVVDVGTGSGCIGITLSLEIPSATITLVDISQKALDLASKNSALHKTRVKLIQSNLLDKIRDKYDIIVANLPYVDKSWEVSKELAHEPIIALYAEKGGLDLINKLLKSVGKYLVTNGYLVLEADPEQHKPIIDATRASALKLISAKGYILVFRRD